MLFQGLWVLFGPGIGNVLLGKPGPAGLTQAQNIFLYLNAVVPVGFSLKVGTPDLNLSSEGEGCDEDECEGVELGGLVGKIIQ